MNPILIEVLNKAAEQLGDQTFHHLIKILTDGVPDTPMAEKLWENDDIVRQPSKSEATFAARLALGIEDEFRAAFFCMFLNADFRAFLKKDMQTGHARKMAKNKRNRRNSLFEAAFNGSPEKSTKEILKDMEARGEIEDIGDFYLMIMPGSERNTWPRISKNTIDSKISRLRKILT